MKRTITHLLLLLLLSVSSNVMADNVVTVNGIKFDAETADVVGADPIKNGVLTIPETVTIKGKRLNVTGIQVYVFSGRTDIRQVEFPKSLKTIGSGAFGDCLNLESVTLPDNVETIGDLAFSNCLNLKSFVFNNKVKVIPQGMFEHDLLLENVVFPEDLETIENLAFMHCESLREIVFPNKLKKLCGFSFTNCTRLTKVVLPESLEILEQCVFGGCTNLKSIIFLSSTPPTLDGYDYYKNYPESYFFMSSDDDHVTDDSAMQKYKEILDGCTIVVPEEAETAYNNSEGYNLFEVVASGIDTITTLPETEIRAIYDISGRRLSTMKKGVNVVKYNNGLTKKIKL